MAVEDQITAMRPLTLKNPFGWLDPCFPEVCARCSRVAPQGDMPHHLFVLYEETETPGRPAAQKKNFGVEPLSPR